MKFKKESRHFPKPYWLVASPCRLRGMTLLETVVWVSITTMVMLAIAQSVLYFYRINAYAVEQSAAVSSAQRGLEQMVKTLREAAYSSNGAYPIISIATSSVSFYADIDTDPFIEQIRYFVEGATLKRGVIDPSGDPPVYTDPEQISTISDYVRNIEVGTTTFQYYDQNGALMTDFSKIGDVRFISAAILVNIDLNRLPNQLLLRSSAALRNLQ